MNASTPDPTSGTSTATDSAGAATDESTLPPPKWKIIGPGLVVAATGIGAGDLVATLVAGANYGYALLWAVIAGVIIKIALVEGAGRYTLATGHSIFEGWRKLGVWTSIYFGPYIIIWGFVYGATAMSASAIPIYTVFPQIPLAVWAIISGLVGAVLVWFGKYASFEKVVAALVGLMFVTVVGCAALTAPNLLEIVKGLRPWIPEGGLMNTLAIAGGVGGTITLAAYGYWLREKGWNTPRFMKVMRIDNAMAYVISGVFVVSMLIMGAELLYSSGIAIGSGDDGLVDLGDVLAERYNPFVKYLFLIGFWASSFSSILGVWHGVSLQFADYWGHVRKTPEHSPERGVGGKYYRFYVLWLTFPPMLLLLIGKPVGLILAYGVLGSFFMPFMSITLLFLLNSHYVPKEWRNGWFLNTVLVIVTALFVVLGANQLIGAFQ
ncbi:Nramp family divalent metal transporter [Brevibacterium samyangense]|uniref:Nramp family divalent metal transporter n=1 Tax=Brevibacterium samyangense TaxID=366888 RepID=A0ABP5F061_9MICO